MKSIISILIGSIVFSGCAPKLTADKKALLKQQLEEKVKTDQVAAYLPQGKYKDYTPQQWENFKDSVFTSDKLWADSLFDQYGFLGFDKVGKDGSTHFWLLVQHCDKYPEFQKKILKAMDVEVKRANANAKDYAYLYDRVKINAGQKQLFGTQLTYETQTTGRAYPKIGLADSANIDRLRKKYDLPPLKDYLNEMTTFHYEMNKDHYQKMGITKPNLY
jgi:hypothetical protein